VPELGELLNDNDPSARAEALVALRNLAGKGTPPAELKSLSAQGDPAVSPRVAGMLHRHAAHDPRPFDKRGAIVLQQKCSRAQVEARFINMPPCLTLRRTAWSHSSGELMNAADVTRNLDRPRLPEFPSYPVVGPTVVSLPQLRFALEPVTMAVLR
jgi:hypothetical protein